MDHGTLYDFSMIVHLTWRLWPVDRGFSCCTCRSNDGCDRHRRPSRKSPPSSSSMGTRLAARGRGCRLVSAQSIGAPRHPCTWGHCRRPAPRADPSQSVFHSLWPMSRVHPHHHVTGAVDACMNLMRLPTHTTTKRVCRDRWNNI